MKKCDRCDGWGMLKKDGSRLQASENNLGIIICSDCKGTGETNE